MKDEIVNRVAKSGLLTIDLEDFLNGYHYSEIDFKEILYEGLVLREEAFRTFIKTHDWSQYKDQWVAIHCSEDAIIPSWAYMLITASLSEYTTTIYQGSIAEMRRAYILNRIDSADLSAYNDKRVLVKGCGKIPIPEAAYVSITGRLLPIVKSLMYGEACSAVPVFKRK